MAIYFDKGIRLVADIHTKRFGFIVFGIDRFNRGKKLRPYLYVSPNATPWAATFVIGRKFKEWPDDKYKKPKQAAKMRRMLFGHNNRKVEFEDVMQVQLRNINERFCI